MNSSIFTTEYEIAWGLYLLAALGCFWVWTFFTGWMWRYLREPLWVIAAVVLFTPTLADPSGSNYVPAFAMAAMDILFKVNNDAWRALADLTLIGAAAFVVYLFFVLLRWLLLRNRPNKAESVKNTEKDSKRAQKENSAPVSARKVPVEPTLQEILAMEHEQGNTRSGRI
ncbi:MAG: MFS transporter [Thiopseudomonas sp.]|nr:MFS transporter [Thiopseudomonas sp.]